MGELVGVGYKKKCREKVGFMLDIKKIDKF